MQGEIICRVEMKKKSSRKQINATAHWIPKRTSADT